MILIGLITGRAVGLESTPGEPALTQVFFLLERVSGLLLAVGLLGLAGLVRELSPGWRSRAPCWRASA